MCDSTKEIPSPKKADSNVLLQTTAINTAMTNICYIINRLADNSNICKTISVAGAGAFVSFTSNPTCGQFWFLFILICILAFNDGLYMGLKEDLQLTADKLSNVALSLDDKVTNFNPFDLKKLRAIDINNINKTVNDIMSENNGNSDNNSKNEPQIKKGWKKIKRDAKTAKNGFCTITTWPFYSVILIGMLIFRYWDGVWNSCFNCYNVIFG